MSTLYVNTITGVSEGAVTVSTSGLIKLDGDGAEIENDSDAGAAALLIDNDDVDQIALDIDAANTTANVIDVAATALTSGKALFIDAGNAETTSAAARTVAHVDFDKTGIVASGQTSTFIGLDLDMDDAATNVGTSTMTGLDMDITSANDGGTVTNVGVDVVVTGADTNTGVLINCEDGGSTDLQLVSSADTGDYFSISTTTHGATMIRTIDDNAAAGNLTFSIDGAIKLDGAGVEIENDSATGATALLIDNDDVDQLALGIDAANTTANVIHVAATALTSGKALFIDAGNTETTSAAARTVAHVDFDKTGIVASGQTSTFIGLDLDMNDAATNVGTSTMTGLDIDIVSADAGGTTSCIGLDVLASGADTNYTAVFNGATAGNAYVGIGTSAPASPLTVYSNTGATGFAAAFQNDGANANRYGIKVIAGADDGSGTTYYVLCADGDGSTIGYIANIDGTFATTDPSDARIKDNIRDTAIGGLEIVEEIRVRDFELKSNGVSKTGFVAQELEKIYPAAVMGKDNDVDENGEIAPMGVAYSILVPALVKAVQELSAKVTELENKLAE